MKNKITTATVFTFLSLIAVPASSAMAENVTTSKIEKNSAQTVNNDKASKPPKQQALKKHRTGKPPQHAIESCLTLSENNSCSFQGPNFSELGVLENGTCEFTPDKQYFACKPERPSRQMK